MRIGRKYKKFKELSRKEQLLFSEALFLQFSVGLLLKIIPFRWIPGLFSSPHPSSLTPHPSPLTSHISYLKQIQGATQRASRISPWKNKCLIQSLSARRMLNKRKIPSQLSLGVAKGENGKLIAHAWLKAGDFEIVEKGGNFSELYLF